MYMTIKISDANSLTGSRAEEEPVYNEGDLVFGDLNEHQVNSADFFFYNEEGEFIVHTSNFIEKQGETSPNIEWFSKNTIALENIDDMSLPKYVITVLNAPADFVNAIKNGEFNMEKTRKQISSIVNEDAFIMSTTSFLNGDAIEKDRYDDTHYYATKLKPTDLIKHHPTDAEIAAAEPVNIYVERLATKFEMIGLNENNAFKITATVAGMDNNDDAATDLWVKIVGFGISCQNTESYLSKNLDGYTATDLWDGWNDNSKHRSFWGKSYNYDNATPLKGNIRFWDSTQGGGVKRVAYGYETTRALEYLRNSETDNMLLGANTPNFVITAKVYTDAACTKEFSFVNYGGQHFTDDRFKAMALSTLQKKGYLKFYKNETSKTVSKPDPDNEGSTINTTVYHYDGLEAADYSLVYELTGEGTGVIKLVYGGSLEEVFVPGAEGARYNKITDKEQIKTLINADLAKFTKDTQAVASTGGATHYDVPVEHLLGEDGKNYKVTKEGMFGTVRNHWYQLSVSKVSTLGNGVFNPGDGEGKGEEIIPVNPPKERYDVVATINILSWKIVKQNIEL